ncbi:MAG: 1-deoxy-D-xylulose-5-phosphate reductoisomerase [Bacteroidia bacterium]
MVRVTVLGASGSIGQQTLSLLQAFPERYELVGLSIHTQLDKVWPYLSQLRPKWLAITDAATYQQAQAVVPPSIQLVGPEDFYEVLVTQPADIVVNGIVGAAGFRASWHVLHYTTGRLALANKESLVFGGQWLAPYRSRIIPVDSEHSAIFQCLQGEKREAVARLVLTASGGPFHGRKRAELSHITPHEALRHPVWRMGSRITIDSATLMNKALEIIEAYWLFAIPHRQIEVWIHPECLVHSLVLFKDGSMKAQLSPPDMRFPIWYALGYPERQAIPELWQGPLPTLHFEPVDEVTFPSLRLARQALDQSPSAPAMLNAADELAVAAFLEGRIGFLDIFYWLEWALAQPEAHLAPATFSELAAIEQAFRQRLAANLPQRVHAGGG